MVLNVMIFNGILLAQPVFNKVARNLL